MMSGESTAHSGPSIEPRKRETNSRRTTARINSLCCQARVKGSTIWGGTTIEDRAGFLRNDVVLHRPVAGRSCQCEAGKACLVFASNFERGQTEQGRGGAQFPVQRRQR